MASFRRVKNDHWRADVCIAGARTSKTFSNKTKAKSWAAEKETQLLNAEEAYESNWTYQELFAHYVVKVSPKKTRLSLGAKTSLALRRSPSVMRPQTQRFGA